MEGNHHVGLFKSTFKTLFCDRYMALYYHLGQEQATDFLTLVKEYKTMAAAQAAAAKRNKEEVKE